MLDVMVHITDAIIDIEKEGAWRFWRSCWIGLTRARIYASFQKHATNLDGVGGARWVVDTEISPSMKHSCQFTSVRSLDYLITLPSVVHAQPHPTKPNNKYGTPGTAGDSSGIGSPALLANRCVNPPISCPIPWSDKPILHIGQLNPSSENGAASESKCLPRKGPRQVGFSIP